MPRGASSGEEVVQRVDDHRRLLTLELVHRADAYPGNASSRHSPGRCTDRRPAPAGGQRRRAALGVDPIHTRQQRLDQAADRIDLFG